MPITDLLLAGLNLMLIGMGIVFTFLVLLVFSMLGMSKFAMSSVQRDVVKPAAGAISSQDYPTHEIRGDVVAVIAAAVTRYRTTHN